jgi:hypothetical protein
VTFSGVNAGGQYSVTLDPGSGSWSSTSDANRKTDWASADPEVYLHGIADMNIRSWRYKTQGAGIRHVGPTAQDFRAAFGLGTNDTTISVVDADGVNMLAIQALARRTDQLRAASDRVAALERELIDAQRKQEELTRRIAAIESLLQSR